MPFPNMVPLSHQAPNTHMWLIPSHSVLLLRSLPRRNELLKIFLRGCNLFLSLCFLHQNPICFLHGNGGLQFLWVVLYCFLYYALYSRKFFCHPKCFLLQWLNILRVSLLFNSHLVYLLVNYLLSTITTIRFVGVRVLIVSLNFCAFSYTVCNLFSNACNFAFSNN
jgi:hypothetical protein